MGQIPGIGPIRAALLIALIQTANRFRTKRQLWAYCGLALRTYTSGEYRFVGGQLKRSKKVLAVGGLNINHNHDLKHIFNGAATRAAATAGPFQYFYQATVGRAMKPNFARLNLHRTIAYNDASLSCFRIRKRGHENRMDRRRANTPEPLNMTWAGGRGERFCSFQSPWLFFPLTLPFIERANRPCGYWDELVRLGVLPE